MTQTMHNRVIMWCAVGALLFTGLTFSAGVIVFVSGGFVRNDAVEIKAMGDKMDTLAKALDATNAQLGKLPDQRDMDAVNKTLGSQQAQIDGLKGQYNTVNAMALTTMQRVNDICSASHLPGGRC